MGYYIETKGDTLKLYVPGSGATPLAEAYSSDGTDELPPQWSVNPDGIAEHLVGFNVYNRDDAVDALKAIAHAYEAGGGS